MNTLLIRLAGPMQAWGTQSRFTERDTGQEPSKSGVIGLLCAALGMARDTDVVTAPNGRTVRLDTLAQLPMAVRVEHEGTTERDYHTAGGAHRRADDGYGVAQAGGGVRTVESNRYYLADADFLVGLGSEDAGLLHALHAALRRPQWPLFLGRKAFVPGVPVWVPDDPAHYGPALREGEELRGVLKAQPWCAGCGDEHPPGYLRLVQEGDSQSGARRQDVPRSFAVLNREYGVRYVHTEFVTLPEAEAREGGHGVSVASVP